MKYEILILTHSQAHVRDTDSKDAGNQLLFVKQAAKEGIKVHTVDFPGLEITQTKDGHILTSYAYDKDGLVIMPDDKGNKEKQKPILIHPEKTLIMPRGLGTIGFTGNRNWYDEMKNLEMYGYTLINDTESFDLCSSKYLSYLKMVKNKIRTPRTVAITHSSEVEEAVKKLKTSFPIVLKSSTGTQTGVGVVIVESMRSLRALVQMTLLYNKHLPLIIQEFIPIDYDIRVLVCEGQILGAMKREVISGDGRSNVSLGAEAAEIELTDKEKVESLRVAQIFGTRLAGIDLLPADDREKELPYCLEVNSNPGLQGIERYVGGITKQFINIFKDKDIW
jgi:ribosomal protein S6--L-glutamate ligase